MSLPWCVAPTIDVCATAQSIAMLRLATIDSSSKGSPLLEIRAKPQAQKGGAVLAVQPFWGRDVDKAMCFKLGQILRAERAGRRLFAPRCALLKHIACPREKWSSLSILEIRS